MVIDWCAGVTATRQLRDAQGLTQLHLPSTHAGDFLAQIPCYVQPVRPKHRGQISQAIELGFNGQRPCSVCVELNLNCSLSQEV